MDIKNSWLSHLQAKFKRLTKRNTKSIKTITNKYKKAVGTGLCAVALLAGVHSSDGVKAEDNHNIQTIYHIYVDDERVGAVADKQSVDNLITSKISDSSESYQDLNLVIGEEINLVPEVVFTSRVNSSETLQTLENLLTVKAEALALIVEGQEVSYVSSEDDYNEVIEKLMLQYVSKEELAAVNNLQTSNDLFADLEVGEKVILDVRLTEEIDTKVVSSDIENVLSVEDAIKQLNLGTLEDDIYVVEPGDVLGAIAIDHGLTVEEILALNPTITENSLLQIGDELNVTVYEPVVKVIVEEATKVKEEIPFQTETKDDANMWRGDTKIQQSGQKGERIVSYSITRENGRTIQKQTVTENVTKEPVNRVVLRGTKVSPSRGTGKLKWPAVGGYISSYQGMRWGRYHRGIDIARPTNRSILSSDNGTVSFTGWDGGYGNKVIINHNNGMKTLYAHLSSINVRVGQTVAQGQKIGVMGTTGNSTGIHLHFEVYKDGKLKNPMDFLR